MKFIQGPTQIYEWEIKEEESRLTEIQQYVQFLQENVRSLIWGIYVC